MLSALRGRVVLVTGGSRGVGAATVEQFARAGADVVVNFRNKASRAEAVAERARENGVRALALGADITDPSANRAMLESVFAAFGRIDVLVLNASGGMERDLLRDDPGYPMRINRDANVDLVEASLPLMTPDGVIVHVTSHLAHFYGRIAQHPVYEPVAASKHAGETALLDMRPRLDALGVRLAIISGDLIEDTIVPRLMERMQPGLIATRREQIGGALPTTADMAEAIVHAAADPTLPSGHVHYVGETDLPV